MLLFSQLQIDLRGRANLSPHPFVSIPRSETPVPPSYTLFLAPCKYAANSIFGELVCVYTYSHVCVCVCPTNIFGSTLPFCAAVADFNTKYNKILSPGHRPPPITKAPPSPLPTPGVVFRLNFRTQPGVHREGTRTNGCWAVARIFGYNGGRGVR